MEHIVKIIKKENVTHDVIKFTVEKPENYKFTPGQATEVSINTSELKEEKRPFTFTSLNKDKNLEFIIKVYPEHEGITDKLSKLNEGDELIIRDIWGAIKYKGKGTFIAAGAGITPFIAIFRQLKEDNQLEGNNLIFSNKYQKDIILEEELKSYFKPILTLTREDKPEYKKGRINKELLKENIKDFSQHFYICGPMQFVVDVKKALDDLGANTEKITIEI